jgi:hypothetical protein
MHENPITKPASKILKIKQQERKKKTLENQL